MDFEEILTLMDEINVCDRTRLAYKAGIIMLYGMLNQNFMSYAVIEASREKRILKITFSDTLKVQRNLRKNGILVNGQIGMEYADIPGSAEWIIEFTLMCMAGAGEIVRYEIPPLFDNEKTTQHEPATS